MKELNPSLQFADEEGGVLKDANDAANAVLHGTEQEDFLTEKNVMSKHFND